MSVTTQPSLFAALELAHPADAKPLRPYQREAVDRTRAYWASGGRRALIAIPTGTGKTRTFSAILDEELGGARALVIAHREELLDQGAGAIRDHTRYSVGIEQAERRAGDAQVVLASIQTLASRGGARLPRRDEIGIIIIDEAHHAGGARTYLQALHHYGLAADPGLFNAPTDDEDASAVGRRRRKAIDSFTPDADAPRLLGVTATPNRSDKVGLEAAFDEIVYERTIGDMIAEGWLCDVRGVRVESATSLDDVHTTAGDFQQGELQDAVNTPERNRLVVSAYREHATGLQAIVFCAGVQHAEDLSAEFTRAGIAADWVSGAHDSGQRRGIIEAYKAGRLDVICNVAVLTEGFDHPATSCIIMARPTKSTVVYTQALGRGTRLAPGKDCLVVIDVVDAYRKAGVASANALFGLPPKFAVAGEGLAAQARRVAELAEQYSLPVDALAEAGDYNDVVTIATTINPLDVARHDPVLRAAHPANAWLIAPWGYSLSLPHGVLGVVVNMLGQGTVRWRPRGGGPETLTRDHDPAAAIRWAEQWVTERHPDAMMLTNGNARWRSDAPSDKQLGLARKLRIAVPEGATKGQVSALIDARMARKEAM